MSKAIYIYIHFPENAWLRSLNKNASSILIKAATSEGTDEVVEPWYRYCSIGRHWPIPLIISSSKKANSSCLN